MANLLISMYVTLIAIFDGLLKSHNNVIRRKENKMENMSLSDIAAVTRGNDDGDG